MESAHLDLLWKDFPSIDSPLNAGNLNKMVDSINLVDKNAGNLYTTKFDTEEAKILVKNVELDEDSGVLTITHYNGAVARYSSLLSKIAVNFGFDETTQKITILLPDGKQKEVDLSAFIAEYEFVDTETINMQTAGGKVKAIVKEGSIQEKHLRPEYLSDIRFESSKAQAAEKLSESFAHGNTGVRPGEGTDNSEYYSNKAKEYSDSWKGSLLPKGTIGFSVLPSSGNVPGHMYNINQSFVTDSRFVEGEGYSYPAGTNVYWTSSGKWDCLSGTLTKELTQAEYDSLSYEEKMSGTIYYISDSDDSIPEGGEGVAGLVVVDSELSTTSKNPVQNRVITDALSRQRMYTDQRISSLINGAPETLDTLKEVADALQEYGEVSEALESAIGNKVDKEQGKGLSSNDYTSADKNKLAGIAQGAEVNVQADWNEADPYSKSYIKNKPLIAQGATVDSILSDTSTNAVQNRVITAALDGKLPINGTAEKAKALSNTVPVGSIKQPVYFDSSGKPSVCTGIAVFQQLTQEQYDALTASQQTNGTIYFITDSD